MTGAVPSPAAPPTGSPVGSPAPGPASGRRAAPAWLLLDVLAVLVFVAVGRRSHAEAESAAGLARTAWPFLAAVVAGWLCARAWRAPLAVRWSGVLVWGVTVAGGQLLRLAAGEGSAWSFVVVTAAFLGLFQLGWRAVVAGALRRRTAPGGS